jgi:hypothetical protein
MLFTLPLALTLSSILKRSGLSQILQTNGPTKLKHTELQLVKIAIAIVPVALTPSEGAENHAVNEALLSQQVTNLLRGGGGWTPGAGADQDPDTFW